MLELDIFHLLALIVCIMEIFAPGLDHFKTKKDVL